VKFHVSIFSDGLHPNVNDTLPPCIVNMTEYKFYIFHTHTHTHTLKLVPENVAEEHSRPFCTCFMMYEMHLKHLLHRYKGQHNMYGPSQQAARSGVQTPVVITAFLLTIPFQTGLGGQQTSTTMSTSALSPEVK